MAEKEKFYSGNLRERLDKKFGGENIDSRYINERFANNFTGGLLYRVFDNVIKFTVRKTGPKITKDQICQKLVDIEIARDKNDAESLLSQMLDKTFPVSGRGFLDPNIEYDFEKTTPSKKGEIRYRVRFMGKMPVI